MIESFADEETHRLFVMRTSGRWTNCQTALRKLDQLEAAAYLHDLKIPPGNRLELLGRDRKGQHSIRINDQWRIVFVWKGNAAHQVEIVDYH